MRLSERMKKIFRKKPVKTPGNVLERGHKRVMIQQEITGIKLTSRIIF